MQCCWAICKYVTKRPQDVASANAYTQVHTEKVKKVIKKNKKGKAAVKEKILSARQFN